PHGLVRLCSITLTKAGPCWRLAKASPNQGVELPAALPKRGPRRRVGAVGLLEPPFGRRYPGNGDPPCGGPPTSLVRPAPPRGPPPPYQRRARMWPGGLRPAWTRGTLPTWTSARCRCPEPSDIRPLLSLERTSARARRPSAGWGPCASSG